MKNLVPKLSILIIAVLFSFGCERTYTLDEKSIGSIYKSGYYAGIHAGRQCVIDRTINKDNYRITSFEYADTLFTIDSLKYLKLWK